MIELVELGGSVINWATPLITDLFFNLSHLNQFSSLVYIDRPFDSCGIKKELRKSSAVAHGGLYFHTAGNLAVNQGTQKFKHMHSSLINVVNIGLLHLKAPLSTYSIIILQDCYLHFH